MCASPNNARAGPTTPAPVYDDSGLLNATLMKMFRSAVVSELGGPDSIVPGADGLWELVHRLNARGQLPAETQDAGLAVLRSLFPRIFSPMHGFAWKPLPVAFRELFSRPLPGFASKLNACVTQMCSGWLMGRSMLSDIERSRLAPTDGGGTFGDGKGQCLKIERCRFLESTGCASACVNLCKVPTQRFFAEDMGIPLLMEPDYEDFSCSFSFGVAPPPLEEDEALIVPCFTQCPAAGAIRKQCHLVEMTKPHDS